MSYANSNIYTFYDDFKFETDPTNTIGIGTQRLVLSHSTVCVWVGDSLLSNVSATGVSVFANFKKVQLEVFCEP